jgi:hypothetical protein
VNEKNVKKRKENTQSYTVSVRTFVIPFCYGSGSGTVIYHGTGSATAKSYGSYNSGFATTLLIFLKNEENTGMILPAPIIKQILTLI